MAFSFIKSLNLSRPLIFLCGPYVNRDSIRRDRREILKKWINKNWVRQGEKTSSLKIHAFPIIVDSILNEDVIRSKNLKINLVEEILSQCAYRTYIFLDTMSTSYEYGEFTNCSFETNSVRVFLDAKYQTRVNCPVNKYLELAMGKDLNIYEAEYNEKGFIFFKKNALPSKIIDVIQQDSPLLDKYQSEYPIVFSPWSGSSSLGFAHFSFQQTSNTLTFFAGVKTWFYFMSLVQSKYMLSELGGLSSESDTTFGEFVQLIKKELIASFCALERTQNKTQIGFGTINTEIRCPAFGGQAFFFHCATLLGLIRAEMSAGPTGVSYVSLFSFLGDFSDQKGLSLFWPEFVTLAKTIKLRKEAIQNGVIGKTLVVKGKKRNIITYAHTKFGRDLRALHESILESFIQYLPSSQHSFAYKAGVSTLDCLKKHEGNTEFSKFDIRHFFESVTLPRIAFAIASHMSLGRGGLAPKPSFVALLSDIEALIKPLFFNNSLPIGYVSSPKLSDFALFDLDERMGAMEGITYTRYADDILLSSKDRKRLGEACKTLISSLSAFGLEINPEKTLCKSLGNENDSIRFLGINLVRRKNGYQYTISRQYLVKTSKLIQKSLNKSSLYRLKVKGRVEYIRFVSNGSYKKLQRMVRIKIGFWPEL